MDSRPLIGIDLGTTHSLIAVFQDGQPRLIPNSHGNVLTPSIVGLLPTGEIVIGEAARELGLTHPDRSIACFKRWMGTDQKAKIGRKQLSGQELSGLVLQSLVADAVADLGEPVDSAVITVPAYFNQHQRNATVQAAEMVGLSVDRIVNEPTAAALVYGFHDRDADQKLVVFDLGGGTFDVTVMEIFDGTLEILGTAGESRLGGEDFTDMLVGHGLRATGRQLEHVEMSEPLLIARLRQEAETLKRALGPNERASMRLPDTLGQVHSESEVIEVSQAEFADLVAPLLERLRRPTLRALRDAKVLPGGVDEIILVGGATRMPLIRSLVTELFDRAPRDKVHPDEAVGLGAAVQAALVADDRAVDDLVMTDVCPHSLGVAIVKEFGGKQTSGYFLPVIHRNTTIPVSREETVSTVAAGQSTIEVEVYQGESRTVDENLLIGTMLVEGIPHGPPGQDVTLRFTYDLNGLLEVEAIVLGTDQRVTAVMQGPDGQMSKGAIATAVQRMQALKVYPREKLENQRLLRFGSAAIGEVAPVHRRQLEHALDMYEGCLNENDGPRFELARERLIETLTHLGVPYAQGGSDPSTEEL